ncbi:hypothetical protein [Paenibacillus sp. WLX2291]|uniref:hypothetical protein n=1 Tax=Paenibacillus sp. WLX2291 TaxID=3296934 RepID=UPI003983FF79
MSIRTLYSEFKDYKSIIEFLKKPELIELAQQTRMTPVQLEHWLGNINVNVWMLDEFRLSIQCQNSENEIAFVITDLYAIRSSFIQEFTPEDEDDAYLFPKRDIVELSDVKIDISSNTTNSLSDSLFIILNEILFKHVHMYIMNEENINKLGLFKEVWINRSIMEQRQLSSGLYQSFLNPSLL